jgi:hypothetical protein
MNKKSKNLLLIHVISERPPNIRTPQYLNLSLTYRIRLEFKNLMCCLDMPRCRCVTPKAVTRLGLPQSHAGNSIPRQTSYPTWRHRTLCLEACFDTTLRTRMDHPTATPISCHITWQQLAVKNTLSSGQSTALASPKHGVSVSRIVGRATRIVP